MPARLATAVLLLLHVHIQAAELPSCEADTEAHCLGEEADMSPEGIQKCLDALGDQRSARCSAYIALLAACAADIGPGGICENAYGEGEAVPCLLQRVAPEKLSEACQAGLPKDDKKGLAKFWADGKRKLLINEIMDLSNDDKDTYNRWLKRKGGKKTDKDKERAYAVKTAKKESSIRLVTQSCEEELVELMLKGESPTAEQALKIATRLARKAVDEDMTGTLKPFSKGELSGMASSALKKAKAASVGKDEV